VVKKAKEGTLNLYNFNAHDEEEKNKAKKVRKNNAKTNKKTSKNKTEHSNRENKFNFNNEIVIGIPRQENKNVNTNKNITKKSTNKNKKQVVANNKNQTPAKNKKQLVENTKNKSAVNNKNKPVTKNKTNTKKIVSNKEQEVKNKKAKRKIKIIQYTFLSISILALIVAIMASPLFNIKEIIVEGNNKITKDEIISLSQITVDENTYKMHKNKVEKRILENPYIKSVEVKRKLPSKVSITVEERKATFMIEYGSGYVYINNQGYILEISTQKLEVPIIQGAETIAEELVPGNRLCTEDLEKMSTVIKIMEVAQNNEISNLITRIDIENRQNYKVLFETEEKVAHLGDGTDLNDKIPNIVSILEKEKGIAGEIFVNMDLKTNNPIFRQNV